VSDAPDGDRKVCGEERAASAAPHAPIVVGAGQLFAKTAAAAAGAERRDTRWSHAPNTDHLLFGMKRTGRAQFTRETIAAMLRAEPGRYDDAVRSVMAWPPQRRSPASDFAPLFWRSISTETSTETSTESKQPLRD
jgi:hypothetical protein